MPRTALPPTPVSSTDIRGMDGTRQLSSLKMNLELPEPALHHTNNAASRQASAPESPVSTTSPRTPYPIQPSEAVKARRRSSAATTTAAATARESSSFALPPPPTRSRKIIQMKPRPQDEKRPAPEPAVPTSGKGAGKRSAAASASGPAAGEASSSKKKQPSATSAAGRKIARKTAHSLIERRRRSKMNEEFAVLKDMIPACEGEMHKLAILQASIEYVRYLQDCVEKLKAQRETQAPAETRGSVSLSGRESNNPGHHHHHYQQQQQQQRPSPEEQYSPDVEMTASDIVPSPALTTRPSSSCTTTSSQRPSVSPALRAQEEEPSPPPFGRHDSSWASSSLPAAGMTTEHHRHYSYGGGSTTVSPAVGPGWGFGLGFGGGSSAGGSTLTSPALGPLLERGDLDHEATAALLMLNSDRRGTVGSLGGGGTSVGSGQGRGMSVRDLLSS